MKVMLRASSRGFTTGADFDPPAKTDHQASKIKREIRRKFIHDGDIIRMVYDTETKEITVIPAPEQIPFR